MCFATPPVMRGRVVCESVWTTGERDCNHPARPYTVPVGPRILRSILCIGASRRRVEADVMVRGRYTRWAQPFSFHGAGAAGPGGSRCFLTCCGAHNTGAARGVWRTSHCDTGGSRKGSPAAQGSRGTRDGRVRPPGPAWGGAGSGRRGRKGTSYYAEAVECRDLPPPHEPLAWAAED